VRELLLVRHALAVSNRDGLASGEPPGDSLTDEGHEQALRLKELLATEQIDLGVSTGFARTLETLDLALEDRDDVPRVVLPELAEIRFGEYGGGLLDAYRTWAASELPTVQAPGGGESRAEAAARFARGARMLLERPEERVLVVTHALALRYLFDAAGGLVPAARMAAVEHAAPYRLTARELEDAATLLEEWSGAPVFRDPSVEGRARV
jgi:broad specificity phosphatase PhoE